MSEAAVIRIRRKPGRQTRLSHEKIVEETLALLQDMNPQELTMNAIADRCGTSAMALYKYFPNRAALLEAVAQRTIGLFHAQIAGDGPWQQHLIAWLHELHQHIVRYPNMLKVVKTDGRVSDAWVRLSAPLVLLFSELGLGGDRLAFTVIWFFENALTSLMVAGWSVEHSEYSLRGLDGLSPAEQRAFIDFTQHADSIDRATLVDFTIRELVAHLERVIARELDASQ